MSPTELRAIAAQEVVETRAGLLMLLGYCGHDEPVSLEYVIGEMTEIMGRAVGEYDWDAVGLTGDDGDHRAGAVGLAYS